MSANSTIEWTDATWNPVRGCTKISPGCAHCYAEVFAERFRGVPGHPYEQGFDLRFVRAMFAEQRAGRADHNFRVWTLWNLVAWHASWLEGARARPEPSLV